MIGLLQSLNIQVHVSMEYSRRINIANGQVVSDKTNQVGTRVLDYGSIFLPSLVDGTGSPSPNSSSNPLGANVAVLLLSRGFADITRHRDYEERSHHYDALLGAYSHAEKAKKGYHSKKDYPVAHMNDLTTVRIFLLLEKFFYCCFLPHIIYLIQLHFLGSCKEGERVFPFVAAK